MARRVQRFKQADLTRAIKAALKAGLEIALARIEPDGAIVVVPKTAGGVQPSSAANEWDA